LKAEWYYNYLGGKMPKHVTEKDFQMEVLESEIPVMVDFWAEWCFPCKTIAPLVDELSKEYSGKLKVVKVDVDSSNRIAADYMIMSIPSLLIFKEGKVVETIRGAVNKKTIQNHIERIL
jgi:thioredoxin 1